MKSILKQIINYTLLALCVFFIYFLHKHIFEENKGTYIIAAFGASIVLVFSDKIIKYSFTKIFVSSIIAAFMGVFINSFEITLIVKIMLAISVSVLIMNITKTNYPPAGAITIIPLISNSEIQNLGYWYILYPTVSGLIIIYSFSKLKEKINIFYYGKSKNN